MGGVKASLPRGLFLTDPALPKCTVPGGRLPSLWCLFTEEEMLCFLLHCLFLQAEPTSLRLRCSEAAQPSITWTRAPGQMVPLSRGDYGKMKSEGKEVTEKKEQCFRRGLCCPFQKDPRKLGRRWERRFPSISYVHTVDPPKTGPCPSLCAGEATKAEKRLGLSFLHL